MTITKEAKDLIRALLHKSPYKRLTDVSKIKQHRWFKNVNWILMKDRKIRPNFKPDSG